MRSLWYHGSPHRFEGFQTYEGHTFGNGPSEVPLFFSPSKSFAKMYATGPEGTVYTARLKWRKVFDGADLYRDSRYWPPEYEDLTPEGRALYDDLAEGKVFPGVDEDDLLDGSSASLWAQVLRMDYDIIEDAAFKRWLKKNGYDAAYVTGDGEKNVYVFSPDQVEIVSIEGRWDKKASKSAFYEGKPPKVGLRRVKDEVFYWRTDRPVDIGFQVPRARPRQSPVEAIFEQVRKEEAPQAPSRLDCVFVCPIGGRGFCSHSPGLWGDKYVYKVLVSGTIFTTDGGMWTEARSKPDRAEGYARGYWNPEAQWVTVNQAEETLVKGKVIVIEAVWDSPSAPRVAARYTHAL